jgi:hypothetical protein
MRNRNPVPRTPQVILTLRQEQAHQPKKATN